MPARVTRTSAVIHAVSARTLSSRLRVRIRWSRNPRHLTTAGNVSSVISTDQPLAPLLVPIGGLKPDTRYHYVMQYKTFDGPRTWQDMSTPGEFHTQRSAGANFSFCVLADSHWGSPFCGVDGKTTRSWNGIQCIQQITRDRPFDFCIDLGDATFHDEVKSPRNAEDLYIDYRSVMAPLTRSMPLFYVLGNHEREGGFFQRGEGASLPQEGSPANFLTPRQYQQKWCTAARLSFIPNPTNDTYPEGGEGAAGYDTSTEWGAGSDPWNNGTRTDLQNFYAWTWGDALFIVLDPFRYTLPGSPQWPNSPTQWTLGPTQLRWLERTLETARVKWRFVLSHHLVGGGLFGTFGGRIEDGGAHRAYARGGAAEASRPGTEQRLIHQLMVRHGVQFFLYGHDHAFCHSIKDGVNYLLCGKSQQLPRWFTGGGMRDSYGDIVRQGRDKDGTQALYNILGYSRFHISPKRVVMEWIRTGYSFHRGPMRFTQGRPPRDYLECWLGRAYPVNSPESVNVTMIPTDVDAVRTVEGARVTRSYQIPEAKDYYRQPTPVRPESFTSTEVPILDFPEQIAVVDYVPELVHRVIWDGTDPAGTVDLGRS
jgi:hypothetical protein